MIPLAVIFGHSRTYFPFFRYFIFFHSYLCRITAHHTRRMVWRLLLANHILTINRRVSFLFFLALSPDITQCPTNTHSHTHIYIYICICTSISGLPIAPTICPILFCSFAAPLFWSIRVLILAKSQPERSFYSFIHHTRTHTNAFVYLFTEFDKLTHVTCCYCWYLSLIFIGCKTNESPFCFHNTLFALMFAYFQLIRIIAEQDIKQSIYIHSFILFFLCILFYYKVCCARTIRGNAVTNN